jgi:hypothetical protein
MRISEVSPVVAALVIILLFSPLGASQVQVDVDAPRLQSQDATHDNHSAQQQQQKQNKIPKKVKPAKGSRTTIESNDHGEESHSIGSGPGRPMEESSIPLHVNETEKTTRYQEDNETVDVNDESYIEAASPETDQQQNVQAEMSHTSDSEKHESKRQADGGDHVVGKEKSVESESSIDQAQTHTTSPEEHGVNKSNTRGSQDNRQEASEKSATNSQQDESPGETASHDAPVEDDARAKLIHESTIKEESKSAESSGEEATRKNTSSGDGEDGPYTESKIPTRMLPVMLEMLQESVHRMRLLRLTKLNRLYR